MTKMSKNWGKTSEYTYIEEEGGNWVGYLFDQKKTWNHIILGAYLTKHV